MYSHDGLRDSLTQLAAPTLLYEELKRELARADREGKSISIIRFVLSPINPDFDEPYSSSVSRYEKEILGFAHRLSRLSRDEDICARMGELEFVCVLHGAENAALSFISRVSLSWKAGLKHSRREVGSRGLSLNVSTICSQPMEKALDFLNRLDMESINGC